MTFSFIGVVSVVGCELRRGTSPLEGQPGEEPRSFRGVRLRVWVQSNAPICDLGVVSPGDRREECPVYFHLPPFTPADVFMPLCPLLSASAKRAALRPQLCVMLSLWGPSMGPHLWGPQKGKYWEAENAHNCQSLFKKKNKTKTQT